MAGQRSPRIPLVLSALAWRLRLRWRRLRGTATTRSMLTLVEFYEQLWRDAARQLSATMTTVSPGLWRIQLGGRSTLIQNYVVQIDDPVVLNVAGDKPLCHRLLSECGVPVPEHEAYTVRDLGRAEAFMERHPGAAFVVKPAAGTSGARGVTTHIMNARECRSASVLASLYGERLLIERWIAGESYRLLFLDGEMIHASRRRGRRVTGDGLRTIRDLAGAAPRSVPSQRDVTGTLLAQGLTWDTVLEPGRTVLLESASRPVDENVEMRTVFDDDATEEIGPALRGEAARAVRAIGSRFAGVDIITCDPSRSLEETGGAVNEINTTPGLHHHYYDRNARSWRTDPAVIVLGRLLGVRADAGLMAAR